MCPPDACATATASPGDLLSLGPPSLGRLARRAGPVAAAVAGAAAVYLAAGGTVRPLWDALTQAADADLRWLVAALLFEMLSFAGYVWLLQAVVGRRVDRFDLPTTTAVTFASTAVTRLLPTAGVGGAAFTVWTLRRAGLALREATEVLLTFLVLLYAVYMAALLLAGGGLALGLLDGPAPDGLTLGPAAFGGGVIAAALVVGLLPPRAGKPQPRGRARDAAAQALPALHVAVRQATALLRARDAGLLGALVWWAFDIAVLAAMLAALGATLPIAAAVLAYFVGTTANLVPLPGAVATGMVGVHVAFGVPAAIALVAVLAYRAIALWLPAAGGALAMAHLRRTVAAWERQDAAEVAR